jgi:CubicO group peptidase (beta-lactamase class C family)
MDVIDAVRAGREELRVPGVAVGVLADGREQHDGFGVTSLENPLEVTPDTRFQIGSISKTFTGTVVMYLVAEGLLELDRPVRTYLPELELADPEAARTVTLRHLLAHTAGWFGDHFDDTGWGDDAVARYVEGMRALPQQTPVGSLWAYNNAGFVLAGRVVEVATGEPFEQVVQRLVVDPLELTSSTYWPWEVMTERFAVGHVDDDGETRVSRPWPIGRSAGPAGGIASTTRDLLRYARLHLDPPPELAPMQTRQADAAEEGEWVGLTWYGEDTFGTISHRGGTLGQRALLLLRPSTGFALAVLTNHSPHGGQLIEAALEAAGLKQPAPEPISGAPVGDYTGVYETTLERITVSREGDGIRVDSEEFGGFPAQDSPPGPQPPPMRALFYTPERWIVAGGPFDGVRGHFLRGDDGEVVWLRVAGRLYPRATA